MKSLFILCIIAGVSLMIISHIIISTVTVKTARRTGKSFSAASISEINRMNSEYMREQQRLQMEQLRLQQEELVRQMELNTQNQTAHQMHEDAVSQFQKMQDLSQQQVAQFEYEEFRKADDAFTQQTQMDQNIQSMNDFQNQMDMNSFNNML